MFVFIKKQVSIYNILSLDPLVCKDLSVIELQLVVMTVKLTNCRIYLYYSAKVYIMIIIKKKLIMYLHTIIIVVVSSE